MSLSSQVSWIVCLQRCLKGEVLLFYQTMHVCVCVKKSKNGPVFMGIWPQKMYINPKVINAWNKHVMHHFGGMLALKSGLLFRQQCPFSSAKKWHFGLQNKNKKETKMVDYKFVLCIYQFWVDFKQILWPFSHTLGPNFGFVMYEGKNQWNQLFFLGMILKYVMTKESALKWTLWHVYPQRRGD